VLKLPFRSSPWGRPRFVEWGPAPAGTTTEPVRLAMRELVMQLPGATGARLLGRIERSSDLRTLWYLRSSLMQALANARGESGAREALAELDVLFRQGWPEVPVSRAASLG
jgi:hypothetical protein